MGTSAVEKVVASIIRFCALSFDYCDLEDRGSWLLQNGNNFIPIDMMSHSIRLESFIDTTVITFNLTVYVFLAGYYKYSCETDLCRCKKWHDLCLFAGLNFCEEKSHLSHVGMYNFSHAFQVYACSYTLFLL